MVGRLQDRERLKGLCLDKIDGVMEGMQSEIEEVLAMPNPEVPAYVAQVLRLQEEMSELRETYQHDEHEMKELRKLREIVDEMNVQMKKRDDSISSMTAEQTSDDSSGLQKLLDAANAEISELKSSTAESAGDLKRSAKKARRLSDFAIDRESGLRSSLKSLTEEKTALEEKVRVLNKELETVQTTLQKRDNECQNAKNMASLYESDISLLKKSEDELLSRNESLISDLETFEQSVAILQDQMRNLNEEYSRVIEDKTYLEKSLDSALKNTKDLESHQIKVLQNEIKTLHDKLIAEEGLKEHAVSEQVKHSQELAAMLKSSREKILQLECDIAEVCEVEAESDNMRTCLEQMESSLISLQAERDTLISENECLTALMESTIASNSQTLSKKEEEISNLALKLEQSSESLQSLQVDAKKREESLTLMVHARQKELENTRVKLENALLDVAYLNDDLEGALQKAEVCSVFVSTDACEPGVYEILEHRVTQLDLEHDLLAANYDERGRELERVRSENRALMQSNQKQKVQYMMQLKEDYNRVQQENTTLLRKLALYESKNGKAILREEDKENTPLK